MNPFSMPISSPIDVCKLNYFLYGLKQTPKTWFKIFSALSLGFHLFIIIMTLLFFYR
jgi:hypothetical protein